MRLIAAVFAALLFVAAPARSQDKGEPREKMTPAEHAAKMLEHMDKELKLSADQKAKLKPEIEQAAADRQAMMEKLEASDREHSEKIRALLTSEQKEKYDMMRAKRKMMGRRMREGMEHHHGTGGREGMGRDEHEGGPDKDDDRR